MLNSNEVLVTGGYFEKAKDAIVSGHSIDRAEIRSDPVGAYDIQMMTHSLPAVVTDTDQNNEIIVRGGGPGENLFVMDFLENPYPTCLAIPKIMKERFPDDYKSIVTRDLDEFKKYRGQV